MLDALVYFYRVKITFLNSVVEKAKVLVGQAQRPVLYSSILKAFYETLMTRYILFSAEGLIDHFKGAYIIKRHGAKYRL